MIRRRFALKDMLIVTALVAMALAWRLDHNRLAGRIESLSVEVKESKTEIEMLQVSRNRLRDSLDANMTDLRELRSEFRSVMRDVASYRQEIDLETLVSGVETIESRGTSLNDVVYVTFHNGESYFRRASLLQTTRAQRMLIDP